MMNQYDDKDFDVVIIGGGPSGMAAAAQAAKYQLKVALIDDRPTLGGQIYKQFGIGFKVKNPRKLGSDYLRGQELVAATDSPYIRILLNTTAAAIEDFSVHIVSQGEKARTITFKKLIVSPGAHDRPVVFPGWTLPGVITAGGAQTLVKTQRVLPGARILFVGSGPLALAFPAQLANYGANVVSALEASAFPSLLNLIKLMLATPGNFDLMQDAVFYRWSLIKKRIPMRYGRIIISAEGNERVERVTHARVDKNWKPIPGTEEDLEVDTLCIGYGFVPSNEIFRLLNVAMEYEEIKGGHIVTVDEWGRTSVPHVYASGDGAGVEGSYIAICRASLAAICAAMELNVLTLGQANSEASTFRKELKQRRAFQRALNQSFKIGSGLFDLAERDTIICRCESVTKASIEEAIDSTMDLSAVKGITRAGMGLCQGRNCQKQIAAMIAKKNKINISDVKLATPRFPARPVTLGAISDDTIEDEKFFIDAK